MDSVAGTNFDQIGITGALELTGGTGSYQLNVLSLTTGNDSGAVHNFAETDRSWTILTASGGITGFDEANWTIDTAGFANSYDGIWSIALANDGNDLVLTYIPEPGAALLGGIGVLLLLRRRR